MNYALQQQIAEPQASMQAVKQPQQFYQHLQRREIIGFILVLPEQNLVYWNNTTAELHHETSEKSAVFDMKQFLQWYLPEQRELFMQSLFLEHHGFQLDVTVAFNQTHLRYCLLPLVELLAEQPEPRAHKHLTANVAKMIGSNSSSKIWGGFVRSIGVQAAATSLSQLIGEATGQI